MKAQEFSDRFREVTEPHEDLAAVAHWLTTTTIPV